jgi:hypothetical protein
MNGDQQLGAVGDETFGVGGLNFAQQLVRRARPRVPTPA